MSLSEPQPSATPATAAWGLYHRLLGSSWPLLDEAVRRFHADGEIVCAAGLFRVSHGSNRLARFLRWLTRLPAAREGVDVRLTVTPLGQGEEWRRSFAGRLFVSKQWEGAGGLISERMGLLEIRFQLKVVDGALTYQSRGAALRLGPLSLPLPGWLAPRGTAWEKPVVGGGMEIFVEMHVPVVGLLITYTGRVALLPSPPGTPVLRGERGGGEGG